MNFKFIFSEVTKHVETKYKITDKKEKPQESGR